MSNRFLSILVLISVFGAGYLYYKLSYITNKNIVEIKETTIIEKIPKIVKQEVIEEKIDPIEKIKELREKNKYYKTFILANNIKVYFEQKDEKLILLLNKQNIGTFDLIDKDNLKINLVLGTKSDLYIKVGDNNYYYKKSDNIISKLDLNITIKYIKKSINNNLVIVTEKGSFLYEINKKELTYFSYFFDFIYYNDGYLGVVNKKDKRIRKNLGLNSNKNIAIYYNPKTKEKNIIHETDLEINKIYIENNKIFIIDNNYEKFELENIN